MKIMGRIAVLLLGLMVTNAAATTINIYFDNKTQETIKGIMPGKTVKVGEMDVIVGYGVQQTKEFTFSLLAYNNPVTMYVKQNGGKVIYGLDNEIYNNAAIVKKYGPYTITLDLHYALGAFRDGIVCTVTQE